MAMAEREGQGVSSGAPQLLVTKAVGRDSIEINKAKEKQGQVIVEVK